MMPEALARLRAVSPIPVPVVIGLQLAQSAVLFWLLGWLGLAAGERVGLDAPLLRAWVYRLPLPVDRRTRDFRLAIVAGLAVAALIVGLDLRFAPYLRHATGAARAPSAWLGLLAAFYGGISEEVLTRLFLMTGIAWLLAAFRHARAPGLPAWIYWTAIVAAALLFAAGHLPAAIKLLGADPIVVTRTLVLNFPAGFVFGWLYWKRGLEHAMAGHFAADIVLHVLAPLAFTSR